MTQKLEKEIHQEADRLYGVNEVSDEVLTTLTDNIVRVVENNSKEHLVKDFMITFNQNVRSTPKFPETKEEILLRLSLLSEELFELANACGEKVFNDFKRDIFRKCTKEQKVSKEGNLVEVLDAFCDLQYILAGTVHSFGMGNVLDEAFEDVHDSNMSKVCTTFEEANRTVEKYLNEKIDTYIKESGKYYIVYRKSDNKVLKSIQYIPVNLSKYIKEND